MATVRALAHEILRQHQLTTIFGNPGSNELPFLADLGDDTRYILGLHEGVVVGMADGYAQATGRPAFVNLHAASGSGNAMGALTNAVYSRSPLVLTAGQQVRSVIGMEGMLASVDAINLMKPLAAWAAEPTCAQDVPRALRQAIAEASLRRAPTYLSVPYDDWDAECSANEERVVGRVVDSSRTPSQAQLDGVLDRVAAATSPAFVFGGDVDVYGLFDLAVEVAEALDAPVWAAPSAWRAPFPNRHRLFRGVLPAGIAPIGKAFAEHDLVVVIGAPVFRYHQHVPGEMLQGDTQLIQITDDPGAAARAPMGDALVCDIEPVMRALAADPRVRRSPAAQGKQPVDRYTAPPEPAVGNGALHPDEVFATLRETMPENTAYVVESTSTNTSFWAQMDLRHGGSYYFPASGGLGFGMPAAVGVAMGAPDRPVVGIIGDGSANYGITALWSAAQYEVPVTFVILRNGAYGALQWFARLLGVEKAPGTEIPGIDFEQIARGYGVAACTVTTRDALAEALATPRRTPFLIQVDTEMSEPT